MTLMADEGLVGVLLLNAVGAAVLLALFARKRTRITHRDGEAFYVDLDADSEEEERALFLAHEESEAGSGSGSAGSAGDRKETRRVERRRKGRMPFAQLLATDADVVTGLGKSGYLATISLAMTRTLVYITLVLTIVAFAVLFPLYATGEGDLKGFKMSTVGNVGPASWRLYPALVMVLFTALTVHLGVRSFDKQMRNILLHADGWLLRTGRSTIAIHGLPTSMEMDVVVSKFTAFMTACHPNMLFQVAVAPEISTLVVTRAKLAIASRKLAEFKDEDRPFRPSLLKFWQTVSGRRHFADRVATLESTIEDLERQPKTFSGRIFVTFATVRMAFEFITQNRSKKARKRLDHVPEAEELSFGKCKVAPAPEPEDILWDRRPAGRLRWFLLNTFVIVILVFFTTPVSILSGVREVADVPVLTSTVHDFQESTGYFGSLLFAMVPTLLIMAISSIMPIFLYAITDKENHPTRSAVEALALRRAYVFLVANILIMPGLVLTSLDVLISFTISDPSDVFGVLGMMFVVHTGSFFVIYTINTGVMGNLFDLVRIADLVTMRLGLVQARTAVERSEARRPTEYSFSLEYAYLTSIFLAVITFSTATLFVLPAGLLCFSIKYLVDKYNFLTVEPHRQRIDLSVIHRMRARLVFAACFHPLAMSGFFAIKSAVAASVLSFCCGVATGFYLWYRFRTRRTIAEDYQILLESDVRDDDWRERAERFAEPPM